MLRRLMMLLVLAIILIVVAAGAIYILLDRVDDIDIDTPLDLITSSECKDQFGEAAFLDPNGNCYACPEGFDRTVFPVTGDQACRPQGFEKISTATFIGSTACGDRAPNAFLDPRNGGECWACPTGYNRTVFAVTENNACEALLTSPATRHARATGLLGTDCPSGQFWDGIDGHCYSCPSGYNRTLAPVTASNACDRFDQKSATQFGVGGLACPDGAFFDPRNGGECWSCPDGFNRSLAAVTADNACSRSNDLDMVGAIDFGKPD